MQYSRDRGHQEHIVSALGQHETLPKPRVTVVANHDSIKSVMAGMQYDLDQSRNQYAQQPAPEPGV